MISSTKKIASPKIRIDLEPFQYNDQNGNIYVSLKDPLQLSDNRILIPQDLFYLVQYFDGQHSINELRETYSSKFKKELQVTRLAKLIKKLDQSFLLDNDRSLAKTRQIRRKFAEQKVRTAACAGSSYPESPAEFEATMRQLLLQAGNDVAIRDTVKNKSIKAIIAPHIDPRLGGHVYASTYQALLAANQADIYVILGISHQPTKNLFALTKKDFQTPVGLVQTETEFVEKLLEKNKIDYLEDELVHRDEHSIEFQTLFLKHSLETDFRIVPILASFSHIRSGVESEQLADFIHSLKSTALEYPRSVCIIASVDFAHIGPLYGDAVEPDPFLLSKVEQFDKSILEALDRRNVDDFERLFSNSSNKYNICGYPALRTLLEVTPYSQTHLINYDNAIMDDHRSTVTFAGMIFI